MDYKEEFEHEKMGRLVFRMALPMVAAQLVNLLYNIVDRIYIGHIPGTGTTALAGVGLCNTLIILIAAFASFAGGGGAPLMSIALGQGDTGKAEKIMNSCLALLLVFAVLIMVICFPLLKVLLQACGASDTTLPYAFSYMRIYLLGTLFVLITLGLAPFVNAQGKTTVSFVSVASGAFLNIVLDPVFIFGMNLGVRGAALATILSQAVSAGILLRFLLSRKAALPIIRKEIRLDFQIFKEVAALGVSPFVMTSTESLIGFVLNGQLSKYGDIYVSALAIMQSGMQLLSVPIQGLGQGCSPIISYNYGHRNAKRLKESIRMLILLCFVYNFVMVIWMVFWPRQFSSFFTSDPELLDTVAEVMPFFMSGMAIFGIQRGCQNTFVAMNQAKISLIIALLRKIILLIPLVYLFQLFIRPGYLGVYLAESVADATAACCCMGLFLWKIPKILKSF